MTRAAIQGRPSAAGQLPALPDLRRPMLVGVTVVVAFLLGFGLWGTVAPLSSAALAPGVVAVDSKRKTVQHLEGGIVSRILVHEGERVAAGQPLVRLDTTQAEASRNVASGQLRSERALEARLAAERDGTDEIVFPPDLPELGDDLLDAQRRIFAARAAALAGQRQILAERVGQLESQIEGLRAQEVAALKQRRLIEDEVADVGSLVKQGLELMPRLRSLERTRAELDGRIGQFRAGIAGARQAIGETRLEMIDLDNRRAEEVVSELRDVQRAIADLREEVHAAEDVLSRRDIVAPVGGSIVNLATVTPGGVVSPGDVLMELVPTDDQLTVSARLRPTDIESVRAGLPAEVRLTAFKAWSTPTLHGEVTYVSADALADQNTGETYYDLRVKVDQAEVERAPEVSLYPGMPVQTTVVVGERPFLEYLIQPIRDSFSRAFREE